MFRRLAIAAVSALGILLPGSALAQVSVSERLGAGQPPVIIADRARSGGYPENSLAGIRHAIETGIDMVKIDAQLTGDGHYVLMHDAALNRTTDVQNVFPDGPPSGPSRSQRGGQDYIGDYTLAEIGRLRLTDGEDGGVHSVPTLEEALDLADGRLLVALDLKNYEAESIVPLLRERDTQNMLLFGLFWCNPEILPEVSDATSIRTFVAMFRSQDYVADLEKLAEAQGATLAMVSVRSRRLTPEFVALADELGILFSISGIRGGEDSALRGTGGTALWLNAMDSGAAAYLTGEPEALLDLLGR